MSSLYSSLADISLTAKEFRNELLRQASNYFLRSMQSLGAAISKVPPCDAYGTAGRIPDALSADAHPRDSTFYHNDLNATSPSSARRPTSLFESNPHIVLFDGGIIGDVPHSNTTTNGTSTDHPDLMNPD